MKSLLEFLQSQLPWLAISWSRLTRLLLLCQSSQHKVYTSEEKQKEKINIFLFLTKVLHKCMAERVFLWEGGKTRVGTLPSTLSTPC